MQDLSLLNTIIGPVMRGPSSAHSAAPYLIADTIRQFSVGPGERLLSACIRFDPTGSFSQVYSNQGSDEGFAAGLWGEPITSDAYRTILPRLKIEKAFAFDIQITDLLPNDHPNRVEIKLAVRQKDDSVRTDLFKAMSTGGGMFVIDYVNGATVHITGAENILLVEGEKDMIDALLVDDKTMDWSSPACKRVEKNLIQYNLSDLPAKETMDKLGKLPGIRKVRYAGAAQYPVVSTQTLLRSTAAVIQNSKAKGGLAAQALMYESKRLGLGPDQTRSAFEERFALMMQTVQAGLSADNRSRAMKYLRPSARKMQSAPLPDRIDAGFLKNAIVAALAVMEENVNRGVVVAAPTAGSAGIIPGILFALSKAGIAEPKLTDALQVMALIGALFAIRGSFAADTGGCSVETGASSAMAAGGLVYVLGGDAEQSFQAASLCLMNTMGLICDPVGGEVEIPCHARNIAGVSHAQAAAISILSGFDAVLPFDDMVAATVAVGRKMHPDLRCTARGGCAATAAACKLRDRCS